MVKLRGAFSRNPRMMPLIEGEVQAKGIELEVQLGIPGKLFEWHLQGSDCDVFEFSISHHLTTVERNDPRWDWVAIPIFLSKAMLATNTYVRADVGIESAADLGGKRFGVPDFSMTAALWLRAMLDVLYGIKPQDVEWFVGRPKELCHDLVLGIDRTLKQDISVKWLYETGALGRLLANGELDAAVSDQLDDVLSAIRAKSNGAETQVHPLFPDGGLAFFADFYRAAGFLPVNHAVMVRRRVAEEHPWVPEALYEAFEASKQAAYRRDPSTALVFPNADPSGQRDLFGPDPFPSGLTANRPMLELCARQSLSEGLITRPSDINRLFAATVQRS